jgi:hypothetical protein
MKPNHVATTKSSLAKEAKEVSEMLKGKIVLNVFRHRTKEIGIEFVDGTRLFVDMQEEGLELSITEK